MNETELTGRLRLAASRCGAVLWRNNSGVAVGHDGRPIRFGLANISRQMNQKIKSSDLIGWSATGLFVAVEVKQPGWRYTGTPREQAQARFLSAVKAKGGLAGFATCEYDLILILLQRGPCP